MASSNINWMGNRVVDEKNPLPYMRPIGEKPAAPPRENENMPTALPLQAFPEDSGVTLTQQGPPPVMDPTYIPGYLAQNMGKNVRAEFVIGTNQYMDKTGKLIAVGVNYFVLEDFITRAHVMCDLYSVKFVTTL